MDERIESITRDGSELVGDYVTRVTASSAKFLETLLGNVTTLVKGVITDGAEVVAAATSPFVADEEDEEPDES